MYTIADLFEAAGYPDYTSLPVEEKQIPKKTIMVKTVDSEDNITERKVTGLYYKGYSENNYSVISPSGTFIGTADHLLYMIEQEDYVRLEDIFTSYEREGTGINNEGSPTSFIVRKVDEGIHVLDMEVEDTHSYFSGGLLSHNTFGGTAALLSEGLRKLNPYISRYNIGMILINQVRDDIGGFSPVPGMKAEKTTGGRAVKFYSSWRGRVSRTQDIKIKGVVAGNGIKVKNVKNKVGPPKRVSEMVLYYDRGFDTMDEYINFIANEEFELADVKGAWIYGKDGSPLEGGKWQGRAKLRDHLESNPDVLEKCKVAIIDKFHENLASDADPDEEEETSEVTDWAQYDE